ncbi:hypothetical protein ADUPG1_012909 [Aduncisulcus paluster]|uniref:Uncharacterized protein n=1 Tax=Aduncisulcus paluster TaxID=2918883 RepID=A0ABQ5K130_9EUKA|nr:hypothetical protein ADUPG1_012909 [Aduncisulcus paluster]
MYGYLFPYSRCHPFLSIHPPELEGSVFRCLQCDIQECTRGVRCEDNMLVYCDLYAILADSKQHNIYSGLGHMCLASSWKDVFMGFEGPKRISPEGNPSLLHVHRIDFSPYQHMMADVMHLELQRIGKDYTRRVLTAIFKPEKVASIDARIGCSKSFTTDPEINAVAISDGISMLPFALSNDYDLREEAGIAFESYWDVEDTEEREEPDT